MRNIPLLCCLIVAAALFNACSPKTDSAKGTVTSADSLVAYLERTPCFGRCPYYSIRVYQSGYAVYEGKNNVEKIGRYYTWIGKSDLTRIGTKALEIGFFDLNEEYRNPKLTDFPTVYVEVRHKGKARKVTHYDASPPPALTEMEDYIDTVFENREWQLHPDQNIRD
jgi:hypothetical protein